ncbi:hypothetical protein O6P43_027307 [Quillaja saponaria]|uniref:Uncharacterized protein n=1 Tax=Quillaja saponaria TaxID=32244 RepID=A0AAD7PD50_QUISA|nr:hypothetical protein O6P43_027288 [Quillaja saponaria]KAJ7951228.1 hypothetical protein O6P43_027307 [Quillaja saponaria]
MTTDKVLERVRASVEEEERQTTAATDTAEVDKEPTKGGSEKQDIYDLMILWQIHQLSSITIITTATLIWGHLLR